MPRCGAHAFVWIGDWTTDEGNRAINEAAAAGFDFIEIPLLRPREFDAAKHKQVMRDAGIEATASVVLPADAHMPEHPKQATKFLIEAMDKLEAAKQRNITLGFEVCNRYETYLYNTLADGREAIKLIDADNVQLHADTYHMNIEEEGFHDPLVNVADVLGYIHMSESHRGLVGSGTVQWDDVFRGLANARYAGPLVLESFAAINPDLAAATCLWRSPRHEPGVMAAEGLRFLREGASRAGLA